MGVWGVVFGWDVLTDAILPGPVCTCLLAVSLLLVCLFIFSKSITIFRQ